MCGVDCSSCVHGTWALGLPVQDALHAYQQHSQCFDSLPTVLLPGITAMWSHQVAHICPSRSARPPAVQLMLRQSACSGAAPTHSIFMLHMYVFSAPGWLLHPSVRAPCAWTLQSRSADLSGQLSLPALLLYLSQPAAQLSAWHHGWIQLNNASQSWAHWPQLLLLLATLAAVHCSTCCRCALTMCTALSSQTRWPSLTCWTSALSMGGWWTPRSA